MKFRLFFTFFVSLFLSNSFGQCFEVTSIFVNSCGPTEGENEMITFEVGNSALNINNITATWPNASNSFLGWCHNPGTAASTAALNATILTSCGWLIEPLNDTVPAGANVIAITSENISLVDNSFEGLADTMYIIYQCAGNTQGHFANSPGAGRTLILSSTGPCASADTVTYGSGISSSDGATVLFDPPGNPTYVNNGCNAPVVTYSPAWTFANAGSYGGEICNNYGLIDLNTLLSPNATTGGTWSGPRVTGNNYDPSFYIGIDSITYTLSGGGACNQVIDSTLVFNVVIPQTGMTTVQSCDSVFINSVWYSASTTFTQTIAASFSYSCDSSVDFTVIIDNAITDSTYLSACNSLSFNGSTFTSDTILRDTVFGGGAGPIVIDTILKTGFEDAEGWMDQASGNWTQIDAFGTWIGNDMYANQFNPNNGIRNVGMNDVGDFLELPPVSNPQTLYYYDRLSSAANGTNELAVEYFDGSNWITINTDICTHLNYELVTTDLTSIAGLTNVAIRITRTQDDRSAYIDDIVVVGSTNASGSTCDSISLTNIDILDPITTFNPANPIVICASNDSILLPGGTYAYSAGTYTYTFIGGANNSCDSSVITEVSSILCDCEFNLGPDTAFCEGENLVLDAGPGFDSYAWQDNSMSQTFNVTSSGTYYCTTSFIDNANNLVTNGDFEQGNTGFTTDYNPPSGGFFNLNAGEYEIETVSTHPFLNNCAVDHTPTGIGNMMIVNGSNVPNTSVWCQNIAVSPNTDYLFSAWAMSLENTNLANVATLNFLIDGVQIGNDFSPSFTQCDWQQFNATWNSGAMMNIQICIESDVSAGNNDYALDDIFFTPFCSFTDTIEVTVNPIPTQNIGPDLTICQGTDTLLDATTTNASYQWQDGSTNATFNATTAGIYFVDVTVNNCTARDSLELTVNSNFTFNETARICNGDSLFLENAWQTQAGVYTDTYSTVSGCDSIINTTLSVFSALVYRDTIQLCSNEVPVEIFGDSISLAGTYSDTLTSSLGCDSISTIELIINPLPNVSLDSDTTTVNQGDNLTITVNGASNTDTYTWTTNLGATFSGEVIEANTDESAIYYLTSTNELGCSELDSLTLIVNPLDEVIILLPNAFSPNGDGLNDAFRIANFEDFKSYTLRVYNRWGEAVYNNQGYNVAWDGTYQGVAQTVDVYTFYIEAEPLNGSEVMKVSGSISLIR